MQRSLVFATTLLLALVVAAWFYWQSPAAPVQPTPSNDTQTNTAAPHAAGGGEPDAQPARVQAPDVAPRGAAAGADEDDASDDALVVVARWPDESPAEGVMLTLRGASRQLGFCVEAQLLTDGDGGATFTGVPRGTWSLRSDRGDRQRVEFTGGRQQVTFALKGGVDVVGEVVDDEDRAIAGASVWLQTAATDFSGGRVVATTTADGTFALSQVPATLSLGAIAAGYAPSPLVDLDVVDTKQQPARVRLQVHARGGALRGHVRDERGAPIAGATVAVGDPPRYVNRLGERIIEQWSVLSDVTDEHGAFAFDGLAAGEHAVHVRADGFGLVRTQAVVPERGAATLDVTMPRAATILGVVTGDDGEPVAGAVLRSYDRAPGLDFLAAGQIDFEQPFGYRTATSGADGRFELRGVSPGVAHCFVQPGGRAPHGEPVMHAKAELEVGAGQRVEWNPVLGEGLTIEGVVLFADGHPMPNVFLTLADERTDAQHVQTNNGDGEFRFLNLDDSTYTIRVQYWNAPKGTLPLQQTDLVPGQGRVELRAPFDKPVPQAHGVVSGRIDDVARRIVDPADVRVTLRSDGRWSRDVDELVDGAFRVEDVEPGRFRIILIEGLDVLAQSDWFELQPGATLDTGALRTEPSGSVRITLTRPPGTEDIETTFYLRPGDRKRGTSIAVGRAKEHLHDNLTPDDYAVSCHADGMVSLHGEVRIVAGRTVELHFDLRAGVRVDFSVWFPKGEVAARCRYTITSTDTAATAPLLENDMGMGPSPTRPFMFFRTIPDGEWRIDFSADDRLVGSETFTVNGAAREVSFELTADGR